jgi:hypothetical protein
MVLATWPRLVLFFTLTQINELDFEIGYGKQIIRDQLNAKEDDLVVHMSSQGNPDSFKTKKKRAMAFV